MKSLSINGFARRDSNNERQYRNVCENLKKAYFLFLFGFQYTYFILTQNK